MFEPRLALASLSGRSDATWARAGADEAGAAFLGGIALDDPARDAAQSMVDRGRDEFLPSDPIAFVDEQLSRLRDVPIQTGVNVRSTTIGPIREVATVCRDWDAFVEINAHCRQDELRAVGCGETLLADVDRLGDYVEAATDTGATVGVKVRAEVPGVDLTTTAKRLETAGASFVHVDAMDTESIVGELTATTDLFVIANNGVRDDATVTEYVEYGADAVSIGRPSDDPAVRRRVASAIERAMQPRRDTDEGSTSVCTSARD